MKFCAGRVVIWVQCGCRARTFSSQRDQYSRYMAPLPPPSGPANSVMVQPVGSRHHWVPKKLPLTPVACSTMWRIRPAGV